ncbi:uncharacterized protein BDR25DRAFT_284258 [Lindgomyces ingoldianus]|uniref:Uncharacterized protein n=1 Tax=Lindgomyces ingoldianus TaxID=673940 RepID=A0ACB6QY80_9PLEO|nr:uncharacterized protein BDR25DRAFT_284258 [Lindgomyces ingoldianus]KAF2471944.1 hypothetical protein BDR25DRAFT_284258 [Lindgomyces ingoldianus]
MANSGVTCLYKEARLNIEPAYPGSTVSFTLPASTTSTFGFRTQAKRTIVTDQYIDQDEDAFAKRHLASDGSMFFRRHHEYPRSFLWRLLDHRKTLEVQSTDLDQDVGHRLEANLTLLLHFSSPIRPFGIAFAEPEDRDALTVFAITTANELYTITLHRDFFIKLAASDPDIEDWCKRSAPNLLGLRVPYRLVALSASELLVSLDDGGILHLTKRNKDDSDWMETLYKQSDWSFRGLLPWRGQNTVRFHNTDLDGSAAAALALSPDKKHIFTVCLNHRIRAWNVKNGRPGVQMDLLGQADQANEKMAPYFIGPSQSTLLAVVNIPGGVDGALYHVVTYSPKQHQFKFWGVRDADNADLGIYDIQSGIAFIPPVDDMMRTTVWNLEEFFVNPGPAGWRGTELWIRARSGPSSKVYSLKFDLNEDSGRLAHIWKYDWICTDSGALSVDGLKQNSGNPSEQDPDALGPGNFGVTEQWLDFLFYPGRFTMATLETALGLFRRGLGQNPAASAAKHGSLKQRISATIATFAAQGRNSAFDYDEFEDAVAAQWQAFYGLIRDLHKRRGESLSLVFDSRLEMPWLVLSDYLSAIRKCSEPEIISLNAATIAASDHLTGPLRKELAKADSRNVARLLNAAASFRKNLPISFNSQFQWQVNNELLQSQSLSVIDRMELLEQNCDLSRQVSDDDLSLLIEDLGIDIKDLTTDMFLRAVQTLGQEEQRRTNRKRQIARFGLDALVRVSQETLDTSYNTLLDLLVLVLFMQFEEDLSEDFDASEVFVEVVNQLKDCAILRWLASTTWSHQTPTGPSSEDLMKALDEKYRDSRKLPIAQTVLEGIFGHRCFDSPLPRGLKNELLTYWSRVWLNEVFRDQNFEASLEVIMGILLVQKEYGLALQFSKFLQEGNWSTYLKGRMHVALGEYTLASICFQKAAYNLALGMFSIDDADTISFIPLEQRDSFSEGLAKYYYHILGLFEKVKAFSHAADFARLGLRSLMGTEDEDLKSDLLSRLFSSSIQTSRFDDAYSAMTRHKDLSLKHSALQTLITVMIQQFQTPALLKFPFVGLTNDVDAILSSLCHKTLNLSSGPPYHQILYSFRICRNDFRGAASILYERLQRLKTSSCKAHDPADESFIQSYLMIINTLSSVGEDETYILAEQRVDDGAPPQWSLGKAKKMLKRQVITLDRLRKEYQVELDRVATIESGQYPFVGGGDEMDIL